MKKIRLLLSFSLDLESDLHSSKRLDPDLHIMNADPKYCLPVLLIVFKVRDSAPKVLAPTMMFTLVRAHF
jgi:hypothetical protein